MITVIGMGPGHVDYVTPAAVAALRAAERVIAFGRIAETAEQLGATVSRVAQVADVMPLLASHLRIAILASGDPGFFGITAYLQQQGVTIDKIIPGLSAFQYFMAALQKNWQTAQFLSWHGRAADFGAVQTAPLTVVLTDKLNSPARLSQRLHELGVSGWLYVGWRLSYPDERILTVRIGAALPADDGLAVVVIEHAMAS